MGGRKEGRKKGRKERREGGRKEGWKIKTKAKEGRKVRKDGRKEKNDRKWVYHGFCLDKKTAPQIHIKPDEKVRRKEKIKRRGNGRMVWWEESIISEETTSHNEVCILRHFEFAAWINQPTIQPWFLQ